MTKYQFGKVTSHLILRQTLLEPVSGYWDGGRKSVFDWSIDCKDMQDSKGFYAKIGSWSANHWFHVAQGKTDKATLGNAKRSLSAIAHNRGYRIVSKQELIELKNLIDKPKACTFEYIESENDY